MVGHISSQLTFRHINSVSEDADESDADFDDDEELDDFEEDDEFE